MPVTIRPICEEDAEAFVRLAHTLDEETEFMLLEPGERTTTPKEQHRRISTMLATGNKMVFVAENEAGELVGYLGAYGGDWRRNRETVYIVIGICQAYTGQGIGRRLFKTMEDWARGWGAHRLELTVMCHNERAVALYKKMGFEVEGLRRDSLKVNGRYVNEYAMAKTLE